VSIQPGGPGSPVTCETCGHEAPFDGDVRRYGGSSGFACSECGARYDYGVLWPGLDVEPSRDRHCVTMVLENGTRVPVVKECAREFAMKILRLASA
jgi:hypothetical protein